MQVACEHIGKFSQIFTAQLHFVSCHLDPYKGIVHMETQFCNQICCW